MRGKRANCARHAQNYLQNFLYNIANLVNLRENRRHNLAKWSFKQRSNQQS